MADMKKVSSMEFDAAYKALREEFETATEGKYRFTEIEFCFDYDKNAKSEGKPWKRPKTMQVNWAAFGTVPASDAAEFGKALMKAAKLAENFIYNGYQVTYGD